MKRQRRRAQMADQSTEQDGGGGVRPNLPSTASSFVAHLVLSLAPLQSGGNLESCTTLNTTTNMLPANSDCVGGVASIAAALRALPDEEPSLFLPWLDRESVFVQMHPLRLGTNRLVLHDYFDFPAFLSTHSLVTLEDNGRNDRDDVGSLRTHDFPLLMTNTLIPPANPWREYAEIVHFDDQTGLALAYLEFESKTLGAPDLPSAIGALNYVTDSQQKRIEEGKAPWIPVVVYSIVDIYMWQPFLEGLLSSENPPQAIIGTFYSDFDEEWSVPRRMGDSGTWSAVFEPDGDVAHRFRLDIASGRIENIAIVEEDLETLPLGLQGEALDQYLEDQTYLKELDEVAIANDPVVGKSDFMHWTRQDDFRLCMAGECSLGNLWADAVRFGKGVDIAFVPSGGLRGPGWAAGDVRISDLYRSMPFSNVLCSGVMSGVSLFKLLNYSTAMASFEGVYTQNGDRLLQVSGLRYSYNTQLNSSRLTSVDIWNETLQEYQPIERLRYYSFAAESFLCDTFAPFPDLLGGAFDIEGEIPAVSDDSRYVQEVVAEFLGTEHSTVPYDTVIQGRLINDTNAVEPMNLVQTEEECEEGITYWIESIQTCAVCPAERFVVFSENLLELEVLQGMKSEQLTIDIVNTDSDDVEFVVADKPSWIDLSSIDPPQVLLEGDSKEVMPGERFTIGVVGNAESLGVGTAVAAVHFGIRDTRYPGCFSDHSLMFDVHLSVLPSENLNQLGTGIRAAGFSLMSIVLFLSVGLGIFTLAKRKHKVIRASQPIFLTTICAGCFIFISTIIPLSIDDSIVSQRGCDIACVSVPWLASIGFTTIFSALFAKIWRINQIWKHSNEFRRVKIGERDVLKPFLVLLFVNCLFLALWTALDPLIWRRLPVKGSPFETYGTCASEGVASKVFGSLTLALNAAALITALVQAWQARNISTEYSESKYIGLAVFGWLQILVVGLPLIFLLQSDPTARFFLISALLFAICISILGLLYVPKIMHMRKAGKKESSYKRYSRLRKMLQFQEQSEGADNGGNPFPESPSVPEKAPQFSRTNMASSSIYKSTGGGEGLKFVLPQTKSERELVENELDEYKQRVAELEMLLKGVNDERRASAEQLAVSCEDLENITEEREQALGKEEDARTDNKV